MSHACPGRGQLLADLLLARLALILVQVDGGSGSRAALEKAEGRPKGAAPLVSGYKRRSGARGPTFSAGTKFLAPDVFPAG